jgi:hypothetical protein
MGAGKSAVWTGVRELDQSLVNLDMAQLSKVETVVTSWDANGWSPDIVAPVVVQDFAGGLNGEFIIASAPLVPPQAVVSDWYRQWLYWTIRAISQGISKKEILQAIRRRKASLRAGGSLRTISVLQRVMTELKRVRRVLRPHAPPPLPQPQQAGEGLSAA